MIKQLRVILICDQNDQAEEIDNILAVAGFSPEIDRIADAASLESRLSSPRPIDLVLLFLPNAFGPLDEILHQVQQTRLPPPVICIGETNPKRITDCLQLGAADHVDKDNPAHLVRVIEREMNNLAIRRESAKLKSSYAELETRYRQLVNDFEQPLAYVHDGIHMFANPAWFELFQLSPEDDLSGVPLMDLLPAEQHEQIRPLLKARDPSQPPDPLEVQLDDETWQLKCVPVTFDGLPCVQVTLSRHQQTEDNEIARHLNHLMLFDIASGLFSRTHFIHQLERQAASSQAGEGGQQAVILVSLENFDDIASASRLSAADKVYAEAGREIKSLLSVDDLVCRYDQSTFGLLIRCTDLESLKTFTTRLVDALNAHQFSLDGQPVACHFAAGCALLTNSNAYEALSRAAECIHEGDRDESPEISKSSAEKVLETPEPDDVPAPETPATDPQASAIASIDANWAAQIREALKKNRFRLQFKTLFPVNGDNRKRYRVSLKMTTVHNGDIDEEIFLPSARRKGLTAALDQWLMDNLFRELEQQLPKVSKPKLFVQLSEDSLFNARHFHSILQRIQDAPAFQSQLVIEFTLQDLVDHLKAARTLIESLRPLGCEFSVKQSREFPDPFPALAFTRPRYLTLDPDLTGRIDDDPAASGSIQSLAQKAHEDDIRVIAVEVQNANQFFQLKDLGIDYAQGPFFHEDANYEYEASVIPVLGPGG